MLSMYTLRQVYKNFAVLCMILLFVFASADVLMRMATLPSIAFLPALFFGMLPMICLFILPLASCLAVQIMVARWFASGAQLMVSFLGQLRRRLYLLIALFTFSVLCLYVPLLFYIAPAQYHRAKKMLVAVATDQLLQLQPGIFHYPTSNLTIFFERKQQHGGSSQFFNILLLVRSGKKSSVISAQSGKVQGNLLQLHQGTVQHWQGRQSYIVTFENTEVHIDQLLQANAPRIQDQNVDTKFLTFTKLIEQRKINLKAASELQARFLKLIWLALLPLFGMLFMFRFGTLYQSNLFLSVGLSSALFFASYAIIGTGQVFWRTPGTMFAIMYGGTVLFFGALGLILRRNR